MYLSSVGAQVTKTVGVYNQRDLSLLQQTQLSAVAQTHELKKTPNSLSQVSRDFFFL